MKSLIALIPASLAMIYTVGNTTPEKQVAVMSPNWDVVQSEWTVEETVEEPEYEEEKAPVVSTAPSTASSNGSSGTKAYYNAEVTRTYASPNVVYYRVVNTAVPNSTYQAGYRSGCGTSTYSVYSNQAYAAPYYSSPKTNYYSNRTGQVYSVDAGTPIYQRSGVGNRVVTRMVCDGKTCRLVTR